MSDTQQRIKKAADDAGTIESGKAWGAEASDTRTMNNTASGQRKQGLIESALKQGAENAITGQDLARILGLGDARTVARFVQSEREAGAIILSSPGTAHPGYFLPSEGEKGRQEIAEFVCSMESRIANISRSAKTAVAALKTVEGQFEIEE